MMRASLFAPPVGMTDDMRRMRRHLLARTGLAWLIMMQVMMLAFPGYLQSDAGAVAPQTAFDQAVQLMNRASLALCLPLITYCAWPLWRGAVRDLLRRRAGMDGPVALGIVAAFLPSVAATWRGSGTVYFDSVSMFVAFLLTVRFLELCARQAVLQEAGCTAREDEALLRLAGRLAGAFVCVQLTVAAVVGLWWWQVQPQSAVAVTVSLLVMSCPCALAISVPAALAAQRMVRLRGAGRPTAGTDLARATRQIARQNLFGSLAWHLLVTPLAAFGQVPPWVAAVAMLLSSLAVAANTSRLLQQRGSAPAPAVAGAG